MTIILLSHAARALKDSSEHQTTDFSLSGCFPASGSIDRSHLLGQPAVVIIVVIDVAVVVAVVVIVVAVVVTVVAVILVDEAAVVYK